MKLRRHLGLVLALTVAVRAGAAAWVADAGAPGAFPLMSDGRAATLVLSSADAVVVDHAAHDLASDVARVTGARPNYVTADAVHERGPLVLIGTLGRHPLIDQLAADHRFDVGTLRGAWESFVIATVANPFPNVPSALVIVGSDRRGTAFGVYELSQAIGVSPWQWWADVAPAHRKALFVAAGTRRFGPPSVKYRGIFLNDEDWGLLPWAAKTFEPEAGNIGPKTYAKIFELLLRLKANTVWPAMHPTTKPFNDFPENKRVADDYAIVMGSSHAEPMLRNNVGEWHEPPEKYNYVTNREGVRSYWEERVRENGRFENIYTLGMRGVHDSGIQGARTDPERIRILEQVFADQREMLAKYAAPGGVGSGGGRVIPDAPSNDTTTDAARRTTDHPPHRDATLADISQMFCAYKEVLGLYRQGLRVPDDVTIVWPDDNFGYIRNYATAEEQQRAGGFGVYYHLSYLGAPLAYLWLYTTPPALVWEEMTKAYDHGARTIWIANVGDLKPAEIGIEFFLQLGWDINAWRRDNLPDFLDAWAAREFGADHAREIGAVMRDYYQLNFQRKPEHLQWWLPKESPRASALNDEEIRARIAAFTELAARATAIGAALRPEQQDGYFELVGYPVAGASAANLRFLQGELGDANRAREADATVNAVVASYSERTAGGKWRGFMRAEPADDQWKSFRVVRWEMPRYARPAMPSSQPGGFIALEAGHFTGKMDRSGAGWKLVPGLGRTGEGSVAVFPTTAASVAVERVATEAPRLDYAVNFERAGDFPLQAYLVPTQPIAGGALRFAIGLDDARPQLVALEVKDGGADWAQGVLNSTRVARGTVHVPAAGQHTLHVYGIDPGVVLDKLVIDLGGLRPSYLGPPETKAAP